MIHKFWNLIHIRSYLQEYRYVSFKKVKDLLLIGVELYHDWSMRRSVDAFLCQGVLRRRGKTKILYHRKSPVDIFTLNSIFCLSLPMLVKSSYEKSVETGIIILYNWVIYHALIGREQEVSFSRVRLSKKRNWTSKTVDVIIKKTNQQQPNTVCTLIDHRNDLKTFISMEDKSKWDPRILSRIC